MEKIVVIFIIALAVGVCVFVRDNFEIDLFKSVDSKYGDIRVSWDGNKGVVVNHDEGSAFFLNVKRREVSWIIDQGRVSLFFNRDFSPIDFKTEKFAVHFDYRKDGIYVSYSSEGSVDDEVVSFGRMDLFDALDEFRELDWSKADVDCVFRFVDLSVRIVDEIFSKF